jgi:integrase
MLITVRVTEYHGQFIEIAAVHYVPARDNLLERAATRDFRFHDLRHTFGEHPGNFTSKGDKGPQASLPNILKK